MAYVRDVQREEAREGVDTLRHQQWSGAELIDAAVHTVTGGLSSTQAMGHGNTERQFGPQSPPLHTPGEQPQLSARL